MNSSISKIKYWFFLFVFVFFSSNFFSLLNPQNFYFKGFLDKNLILFLISLSIIIVNFKRILFILQFKEIKIISIIIIYMLIIFIRSYYLYGFDSFYIFRTFLSIVILFSIILYSWNYGILKINNIIEFIIISNTIQAFFFILANLDIINVFNVPIYSSLEFGVIRYFSAFPIFSQSVFIFSLIFFLNTKKKKWIIFIVIHSFAMLLLSTRNLLFQYVAAMFIILIKYYNFKFINLIKYLSFSAIIVTVFVTYSYFFSNYYSYFSKRIGEMLESNIVDTGNFVYRNTIIIKTYEELKKRDNLLFGNGYERKEFDIIFNKKLIISLDVDSSIGTILYTEGFIGLGLRLYLILYLIHVNFKFSIKYRKLFKIYSIHNIAILLALLFGLTSSAILKNNYHTMLLILMMTTLTIRKYEKYKIKNDYEKIT